MTCFYVIRDAPVNAVDSNEDKVVIVDDSMTGLSNHSNLPGFLKAIISRLEDS